MRAALLVPLCACGRLSFEPFVDRDADVSNSDATRSDATVGDATTDTPQAVGCMPQHALCDDFENAAVDGAHWTLQGGTVTVDNAIAHRGQRSIRFDMPALSAGSQFGSYVGHSSTLVTAASQLWARAWVRLSGLPVSTNALELFSIQQTSGLGNFVFVRSNELELYVQYSTASDEGGVAPPLNTWFCVVWNVVLRTNNTGSLAFTSDALPAMSIPNTITQGNPPNSQFLIGPFFSSNNLDVAQPAFSVWFDDVILDESPVTCGD